MSSPVHLLDHVAIRVADRDATAAALVDALDVHVIERTERFTLVGPDFAHGKITLLDAEPGGEAVADRIVSLVLAERPGRGSTPPLVFDGGLVVTFQSVDELGAEGSDVPRHSLVGVTLRSDDPPIAAAHLEAEHGMRVESVSPEVAVLSTHGPVANGRITLVRERMRDAVPTASGAVPATLDHVGIRVEDAAAWRTHAEELDAEIVRWVDAPHSRAVFVAGPEELLVEFVEHTAPIGARA